MKVDPELHAVTGHGHMTPYPVFLTPQVWVRTSGHETRGVPKFLSSYFLSVAYSIVAYSKENEATDGRVLNGVQVARPLQ